MKKLIPAILAALIVLCGCNANRSFLHQRYTNFKHHPSSPVVDNKASNRAERKKASPVPETIVETSSGAEEVANETFQYTNSVKDRIILPVARKVKQQAKKISGSSAEPVTKFSTGKSLKAEQTLKKRGLLWGVIDAILALCLMVLFIFLVLWLVVVLV